MVDMAQLVSASGCGPEGRRFESDYPPQKRSRGQCPRDFLFPAAGVEPMPPPEKEGWKAKKHAVKVRRKADGRGMGRGHRRALRRPPQCAKAPRRCGATRIQPGNEGRGGSNRRRLSRFFPHIRHGRLRQKVQTNHKRNKFNFSTQQNNILSTVFAEGETISNAEVWRLAAVPPPPPTSLAVRRISVAIPRAFFSGEGKTR